MSATNSFLKEFLDMRKAIKPGQTPTTTTQNPMTKPDGKGGKRKKKVKPEPTQKITDMSLQTIIDDKPNKKEVIKFLQQRANDYTVQKMA
jgi:hypothetical protein